MRITLPQAARLTLIVAACHSGRPDPAHETPCPADFPTFLAAFSEDTVLQAAFTRFPLEDVSVEDGPDEPREVVRVVERAELRGPVFPSGRQRAADGLTLRIEDEADGRAVVVVWKEGTDLQLRYVFVRDGCWTLVRRQNESL